MVRVKWDRDDVDWRSLNQAEYDPDADYDDYDGPEPPSKIVLSGNLKKLWLVQFDSGNWGFKALFEAARNKGDRKQYNGWATFDNIVWGSENAKFRWQPFLDLFGITLADIAKRTTAEDDEDNVGQPIIKIGNVRFSKEIPCRISTRREKYEGEVTARVKKWLPAADEVDEDEDDDDADYEDDYEDEDDDPFA